MSTKSKKLIVFITTSVFLLGIIGVVVRDLSQSPDFYSSKENQTDSMQNIQFPNTDALFNAHSPVFSSEFDDKTLGKNKREEEKVITTLEDMITKDSVEQNNENIEKMEEIINKVNMHIEKGRDYFNQGKYSQALQEYDSALVIVPEVAALYFERAQVYLALNDVENALKDISSSIKAEPKLVEPYLLRGQIYSLMGSYTEAIEDFNTVISLNPQQYTAYSSLGYLYYLQ